MGKSCLFHKVHGFNSIFHRIFPFANPNQVKITCQRNHESHDDRRENSTDVKVRLILTIFLIGKFTDCVKQLNKSELTLKLQIKLKIVLFFR